MTEPEKTDDDKSKFTARNVAKHLARGVVQYKVTAIASNLVRDYTGFNTDAISVKLGVGLVGWAAADAVEPFTDKFVDASFDFASHRVVIFKAKRQARKAAEKTEKKD
jgi:hypothetical protein